jgi:hypothetical protein
MTNNAKIFLGIVVLLVAGVVLSVVLGVGPGAGSGGPGQYDAFATCLKDKGTIFYGAFWCPHCQKQKKMFGASQRLLPYVECSNPDGKGQTQICIDKGIKTYPTWEFADGSRVEQSMALEELAAKTSCSITPAAAEAEALPQ